MSFFFSFLDQTNTDVVMKIIREPKVYLVSKPQIIHEAYANSGLTKFLSDEGVPDFKSDATSDGELIPEVAGRLCYTSYKSPRPGGNKAYINHVKEVKHFSVIEHSNWGFIITNVSRSFSHEHVRHRIASISQLSQRYVDERTAEYVEPDEIANDPEMHEIWLESVKQSHEAYVKLVERLSAKVKDVDLSVTDKRKLVRQTARSVLPNSTETKIYWTVNARSLRNYLELRASRYADTEIRKVANKIYEIMIVEAPALFDDYKVVKLPDGTFELITDSRKI